MTAQRRTFGQESRARELYNRGLSCNAIAKELGVAASTISTWARREGLSFDRSKVVEANAARAIDGKARRQAIVARLYTRSEALLTRLEGESFKTLVRGSEGRELIKSLDFVPTQNERDLAQSISTHLASAAKLEAIDAGTGADGVKSMLAQLGRALGIGADLVDNSSS